MIGATPAAHPQREEGSSSTRLVALDAFRGLTVLGMLVVNNIALDEMTPAQLTHADWSGAVHLADLVFPWFLFIVGVALPFSLRAHFSREKPFRAFVGKAAWRCGILILLGWLVDSAVRREPTIGLGVLQLIGLSYFVAASVSRFPTWARAVLAAAMMMAHWSVLRFYPVPGVEPGTFAQGSTAVDYLNSVYLEPLHLRGLLSVLTTAPLAILGGLFGGVLLAEDVERKALTLLAGGAFLLFVGWLWSLDVPMNKPLWTAPYVIYCAGWAALALAGFYAVVDLQGWRSWALPLVVLGANPIVAYVAPILVKTMILQTWSVAGDAGRLTLEQWLQQSAYSHWGRTEGGVLYTSGYIAFWWLVLFALYRKRVFVKV